MKKSTGPQIPSAPEFSGAYVSEVCDVLTASILSTQHCVILGAPGYGKTAILRSAAKSIAPKFSFSRLDPSTPPEVVRGAYDPAALLAGKLTRVVEQTPYDPAVRVAILDEIFRANDVVFDAMLDVTDRLDVSPRTAPVTWATANFVARGERVEALIDRFALWCWLNPDVLDVPAIVGAHLTSQNGLGLAYAFPDWRTVEEIRAMLPGPHAIKCVTDLLETLCEEATKAKLRPHPRRLAQWSKIVYRVAAFHKGTAEFSELPKPASAAMRFAYPAVTPEEFGAWQKIATAIGDPVGAAIETIRANALTKFKQVASIQEASQRTARVGDLGKFVSDTQDTLRHLSPTDPRVGETITLLKKWFSAAMLGEMPEGNGSAAPLEEGAA